MVKDIAPTTDDPTLPSFTLRVWILGTLFCVIFSYINKILAFRTNAFAISPFVGTLLAYPLGQFMAKVIPSIKFNVPFIGEVDTNPGPFNVKEHVLIYIFSSTGSSAIYALYNVIVQEVFYELYLGTFWDLAFLFCSGAMGFGLSGILRKFLIRPSHMIWPTVLPSVAMFSALHHVETKSNEDDGKKHWSQLRMFGFGAIVMGIWTFIGPGFMSNMLNYLPLMCWIAPKSNTLL
ncbi:OPT oligopeptide transporter protein-domain-containing protein, partial [Blastocladiella britannica]